MNDYPCYIAGQAVNREDKLSVYNPYNGEVAGTVANLGKAETLEAIETALQGGETLSRYQRYEILDKARRMLLERADEFSSLITAESGLCLKETTYEVGRGHDVLQFSAMEALKDDGEIFSCDVSPHGKSRKIFTLREPHKLVAAITPFNHPLNQVLHKIAPAIACGAATILKPSSKTPLVAVKITELLYEAGLPGWMLSVLVGPSSEVADTLVTDPRVEIVSFTGGETVGKMIAERAGYKKLVLELGGNSPLIIMEDADLDLAINLAAEGCFRNSGQRCTAVKRLLVHEAILETFTERFVEEAGKYNYGDPNDPDTRVGTVIDEEAAIYLEKVVNDAVALGARVLLGGTREGALMTPTVIADVPRDAEMVVKESFGPLAPIMSVSDIDDAISLANATAYGLSSGIVTRDMDRAIRAVKGIQTGTVNINQVPGYRIECSPFGGVKDSGLGVKEGVIEAMKGMTYVKTFSMPW
ncbi:MAG: phosphonoacetaldehyde dehydrogenase [Planctomycetota bacterium]|nr:phosphonoacetaldehyde dehydrogenase [Planctomycetota bacterium]MEC9349547.1 phosphonoacetaldehyde dehydrogenase [Planctomycetota bacterium]MEE3298325.1 phosphonoacetaldehyde dehydrogenase [Planctomycetota bacterium]